MTFKSFGLLNIQVLNVEIINMGFWIGLEEEVLFQQTECQTLKIVIKSLDVYFTGLSVITGHIPVEHIPSIENFFFFHALIETPDS